MQFLFNNTSLVEMALVGVLRTISSNVRPALRVLPTCLSTIRTNSPQIVLSRSIITSSRLNDKLFSSDHEWIDMGEGDEGTIGITDYAQDKLGDIVFIELPEVGSSFEKDETFGTIESVKAASDVIAPVTMEVLDVNSELEESPHLVNQHPEGDGWLLKVKVGDQSELKALMNEEQYEKYLRECD